MITRTLQELLWNSYGIETEIREFRIDPIGNTQKTPVIPYNPNRVALVMVNNGNNVLYFTTENNTAIDDGIALMPFGGSVSFQWDRDFILVSSGYSFSTQVGTSKLYYLEVITRSGNKRTE